MHPLLLVLRFPLTLYTFQKDGMGRRYFVVCRADDFDVGRVFPYEMISEGLLLPHSRVIKQIAHIFPPEHGHPAAGHEYPAAGPEYHPTGHVYPAGRHEYPTGGHGHPAAGRGTPYGYHRSVRPKL